MSQLGLMETTYTARGLARYHIEVVHDELKLHYLAKGDNPDIVRRKAETKAKQWDETWRKRQLTRKKTAKLAASKELAAQRSTEAQAAIEGLSKILEHTLHVDDVVDWESLKDTSSFPEPRPEPPPLPPMVVPPPMTTPPPTRQSPEFVTKMTFLDSLIKNRRIEREVESAAKFDAARQEWRKQQDLRMIAFEKAKADRQRVIEEGERQLAHEIGHWETRQEVFRAKQHQIAEGIEQRKAEYLKGDPGAILDCCDLVLGRSQYPDGFPQEYDLDFNPENGILVIDYVLPDNRGLPTLSEVTFVQTRGVFKEKHLTEANLRKIYDNVAYQIALRTIHEVFEADVVNAIHGVVFNGWVHSIDPSTGQEISPCIVSLQVSRDEFLSINLKNVEPKACFRSLKGVAAAKLHSLTPIAPIMTIERDDSRFVAEQNIVDGIVEGDNLAAMDWEEFEHLIREIFEKEFASAGGEVKVTQASRDGGVDAVIFDPDPIRGGKIIVQAKRYTNTVGVSAVRDLYGTVMNEGANKGILVSTANYGPDAYEFAKGKPLVLLSGNNLLHLLEKHGHKARIDLVEAKQLLADQ